VKKWNPATLLMLLSALAVATMVLVACTKEQARSADDAVRQACELLAAEQAAEMGVSVDDIIRTTCAVENVTRDMRDRILAAQAEAAVAAGVALEPDSGAGD